MKFPSLVLFHSSIGVSPSVAMEICCVVGVVMSFLAMVLRPLRCTIVFALLWTLYLSLFKVRGVSYRATAGGRGRGG